MAKHITLTLTPAQADLMERLVVEHQNDTGSNRTAKLAEAVLRKIHAGWMKPEDQPKAPK